MVARLLKGALIIVLAIGGAAAYDQSPTDEQIREWTEYKAKYNKTYSLHEDGVRFKIYERNKQFIELHNKNFEIGDYKYKLRINHLTDIDSFEVYSSLRGHRPYPSPNVTESGGEMLMGADPVPDRMDWRTLGAVSPVKNQGFECGACYAFSTTGVLESHYYIKTKKKVEFSEQYIVDCSSTGPIGNHGCAGGNAYFALRFAQDNGDVTEKQYPYVGKLSAGCRFPARKFGDLEVKEIRMVRSEEDLKRVVAKVGPVTVGIDASGPQFNFYGGGIYHNDRCHNTPLNLNHAMLVVGYGSEDGQDYWILKNSWGKYWGEDGYLRLIRNQDNECGIVTLAIFPIVETLGKPGYGDNGAFTPEPALPFVLLFQSILVWLYVR